MVSKHGFYVQKFSVKHGFVGQSRKSRMTMYNRYLLSNQNVSNKRTRDIHARQHTLIVKRNHRDIVDFEAIGHVANTVTVLVEMCKHNHFVPTLQETLGQLKYVTLYATHIRIEKVRYHANAMLHVVFLKVI